MIHSNDIKQETLVERVIGASARNKFLVIIFTVFAVAAGVYGLLHTSLDAIPDLSDVQVIIYADWEGRSPDLIEDQITYPISARFISAPKVKFVRGESMFGKSFVYVIFEDGTDIYWARSRVLEYLNSARGSLPANVNPVIGPDATGVGWVYEYALIDKSGNHSLADLRSFQDWTLRYALESVKGVSEVASVGGFVKQYQVDLDPNALIAYNLSVKDIASAIQASNNDVGGKTSEVATTEYFVRGHGYIRTPADIEDIVLKVQNGTPVYVKNVAKVHLGGDLRRGVAELDGKGEVVGGIVVMRYGENALNVISGIKKKLQELQSSLPDGVQIIPTYDRSGIIKRAIETLREKLIEESIVVALVCIVFLWHVRSALVAIITLPIAIILSFVPLFLLGQTSNIMSLGGIAIAIGAMIDAAIIMVENGHKALEHFREKHNRDPDPGERAELLIGAAKAVGRPLFFSLLVITVSFIPVFSLTAQEGRLFRPLAFTKTFAMFFASFLGITLVPVLMVWLIRGKITPEAKNPVNRFLIWAYQPCVNFVLRHRKLTLAFAFAVLAATAFPFLQLGKEFMPPLNEGDILYMPTAVPGMSVTEATQTLQIQDRMIRKLPEVVSVFGKAGQSESSTDPAPLSMFETVVQLKPSSEWRVGMTWDKLIAEMNANIKTPGMANIFWMPIQTRTEMLTTGFRSQLGIKVFGKDLGQIQNVSIQIEHALADFPDTRSAFAERTTGGYFLDFTVDRKAAARYGLRVDDINDVIQTAIGGQTIATTVEGRERYPISVRYARDFRNDLDALKRVLVPVPALAETLSPNPEVSGASNPPTSLMPHIPISLVAKIGYKMGPPLIRSEDGQLVGFVFVDITSSDIDGYVRAAAQRINEQVKFPPGYYIQWAGQFQYLKEAEQRLAVVIPFTLLIIFVLIYINTRSAIKTIIVMLAVPFSLVGAFWMLYLLHYNMSVAVWVGLIALAGLDAETGVVMLLYLDQAWEKFVAEGRMRSISDLYGAVKEGAVQRIRPKIMTVSAILFGLLPIMWSPATQAGADVMKRIATPMIGGVITSAILELLIYPVIYVIWRKRSLPAEPLASSSLDGSGVPDSRTPASGSRRRVLVGSSAFLLTGILVASVYFVWSSGIASSLLRSTDPKMPVTEVTQDGVTISILSADGQIHTKENALQIKFKDLGGHPVATENVKVELNMNMPGMEMHSGAKLMNDGMGDYKANLTPEMAGDWSVDVSYQGPQGPGQLKVPVNVKQ